MQLAIKMKIGYKDEILDIATWGIIPLETLLKNLGKQFNIKIKIQGKK